MRYSAFLPPYGYPFAQEKPDPEIEKQILRNQAEALQAELDSIKKRLSELENSASNG